MHEIAAKVGIWNLGGGHTLEPRDTCSRSGTGMILHEIAAKAGTWNLGGGHILEPRDIVHQIRKRYDLA